MKFEENLILSEWSSKSEYFKRLENWFQPKCPKQSHNTPLRGYKNEQLTSKHAWPILLGYAIDLAQFCLTVTSLKRCMGVCRGDGGAIEMN